MGKEPDSTPTEFNAEETLVTLAADIKDIGENVAGVNESVKETRTEFEAKTEEFGKSIDEIKAENKEFRDKVETFLAKNQTISVEPNGNDHEYEDSDQGFVTFMSDLRDYGGKFTKAAALPERLQSYAELCEKKFGLRVGDDTAGGFIIPPEQRAGIMEIADEGAAFRTMATTLPISGNKIDIPYESVTSLASGGIAAGIIAYWEKEEKAATATEKEFDELSLNLYKLFALTTASGEFLEDAPQTAAEIARRGFAKAINWKVEDAMLNGTGAGSPKGVLTDSTLISITRDTASQIKYPDVQKMWMRMYAPQRANAVWLYNQSAEEDIMNFSLPVGTGGSGVMVINASESPNRPLFGRPMIATQHCQALGTAGDLILVDWSQYLMVQKGMKFAESMHLYFDSDRMAYRMIFRVDGRGWWKSALTPAHGSDTLSWCVAIAA